MSYLKVKTKGNADPQGKPRVYFTCFPEDLERSLDKICDDLFAVSECAVYYTEDMTAPVSEDMIDTDLGRMNLFVIPVSYKLLSLPNRAMDTDYLYAKTHHIPILPILLENGLDEIYSRKDRFGEMQYLNPDNTDQSTIPYKEKLKKYLSSVLIDDYTAERIRAAFDAYIFLSYRKKDRVYANQLMRLIHRNPLCQSIAIWYDEFLTPGESFNDSIAKALENSDLFALLVTPNLIIEENYVASIEYPMAKEKGKKILPFEMVDTDEDLLKGIFKDIPVSVKATEEEKFKTRLLASLEHIARTESDEDPAHNFLIGLAYLNGIDVEVDRPRAVSLITGAGEAGLLEAMQTLKNMYQDGTGVPLDYRKALYWAQKTADYAETHFDQDDPNIMRAWCALADLLRKNGQYAEACRIAEKAYAAQCRVLGEEHEETLTTLANLAGIYGDLGRYKQAAEVSEKVYALLRQTLGEEHENTLRSLNNLAVYYTETGDYKQALALMKQIHEQYKKLYGEEHPETLRIFHNLAVIYDKLGDITKQKDMLLQVYAARCKALGPEHPDTLNTMSSLALFYAEHHETDKAIEMIQQAYALNKTILGEEHPQTLRTLSNLAYTYGKAGESAKQKEMDEVLYALRCRLLGEDHPDTLTSMANLAADYGESGDYEKARELAEQLYALSCKVYGEEHDETLGVVMALAKVYDRLDDHRTEARYREVICHILCNKWGEDDPVFMDELETLALTYGQLKEYERKSVLEEKLYSLRKKKLGETNPDTIDTIHNLALTYSALGRHQLALEYIEKAYTLRCHVLGEEHPKTLRSLAKLALVCYDADYPEKAIEFGEKAYEIRRKSLGAEDSSTLVSLNNLAWTYWKTGNHQHALELYEQLYAFYTRIYGPDHQKAEKVKNRINEILMES